MLDGRHHQALDVFRSNAARRRHVPHCFTITAVERERDTYLLTVVAADLEPVRTPACVAVIDSDAAVMTSLFGAFAMPLEQQVMHLHDAVHALWIGRCAPGLWGLPA